MISKRGGVRFFTAAGVTLLSCAVCTQAQSQEANEDDMDEVVVSGYRASIGKAQDIKRLAPSVVEAITLEDLGKFTDSSISDALQRVPGVQIERRVAATYGGADQATIRGLTGSTTTLNGRSVLGQAYFTGTGLRNFDLSSVPPEILSGVTVFKTSTARQIEPGLAGQIDLATLRPLDYALQQRKDFFATATLSTSFDSDSHDNSPRVGGAIGGSFLDDTLGVYASGLYAKEESIRSESGPYVSGRGDVNVLNSDGSVSTVNNVRRYSGFSTWLGNTTFEKKSLSTGLQWKPNENWEINTEVLYNDFDSDRDDQTAYIDMSSYTNALGTPGVSVNADSIVLSGPSGNQYLGYLDTAGVNGAGRNLVYNYDDYFRLRNNNEFVNLGFNAAFSSDSGRLKATLDYSRTDVENEFRWVSPYMPNVGTEAQIDVRGDQPQIRFVGASASLMSDPASYGTVSPWAAGSGFGGFDELFEKRADSTRDSARFDVDFTLSDNVTLIAGAFQQKTDVSFISMSSRLQPTDPTGYFGSGSATMPLFNVPTPAVDFDAFCAANAAFCNQSNFGRGSFSQFPATSAGSPDDTLNFDKSYSFEAEETNTAFYLQADLRGTLFGMDFSGNAGLRRVNIDFEGTAIPGVAIRQRFQNDPDTAGPSPAITGTNDYWETLPSFNLTLNPRENINLRFAAARTMSLADYPSLVPLGGATVYLDNSFNTFNTFSGGNPKLKPSKAWNYDITGEYYTDYGGSYTVSTFYKDVSDLLDSDILEGVTIPGLPGLFRSTTLVNRAKGKTYGAEFSTNQPLTFLAAPWDGFGFQANYTIVESEITVESGTTRFPGFAKYTINLTGYYEKNGWSARVSYLYRPTVFQSRTYNTDDTFYDLVNPPRTTVDLSLSKKLTDHFEIIFTGSNITEAPLSREHEPYNTIVDYYSVPALYSLGLRASF